DKKKVEHGVRDILVEIIVHARAEELERADLEIHLLADLATQGDLGGFAGIDEPSRKAEPALAGIAGAPQKQRAAVRTQKNRGDGGGGVEILLMAARGAMKRVCRRPLPARAASRAVLKNFGEIHQ